jgi:hypothetical protein
LCFGKSKGVQQQEAATAQQTADNNAAIAANQQMVADQIAAQKEMSAAQIAASDRQSATAQAAAQAQASDAMNMQSQMLQAQQAAAKAAQDAIFNVSQKAKNPNVAQLMRDNLKANTQGVTSTMLTGVGGVAGEAIGQLLGKNKLLGT